MNTTESSLGWTSAAALALAATLVHAQAPAPSSGVPQDGISDVGALQQVPYSISVLPPLRAEEKAAVRKLEDRHIQELRALEDHYDKEHRALRAKQYAERDAMLKSFAGRR